MRVAKHRPTSKRRKGVVKRRTISRDWLWNELFRAYLAARKGKLGTKDEYEFEMNALDNLDILVDDVLNRRYKPSPGVAFIIEKPVKREVFAAPFRDRIIHHFLYNMVYDWWDRRLIEGSFSCRERRGVLFGIFHLQDDMRAATRGGTRAARYVKLDLKGYFMSLSRRALFQRVKWGLKRQFEYGGQLYKLLRFLWHQVIFDDPVDGARKRSSEVAWLNLDFDKSLYNQPKGYGIVIGNLSSQLLSNIYLDLLDRFVTMQLGYKHYGRYVDDFCIIVPDDEYEQLKRDVYVIERFLTSIGLVLHPKKRVFGDVADGIDFLGVRVYVDRIVPARRFTRNFFAAVRNYTNGVGDEAAVVSYLGFLKHVDGRKLAARVFASVGWEYQF